MTTTRVRNETNKARDARIEVLDTVSARQRRIIDGPYGLSIVGRANVFTTPALRKDDAVHFERLVLGALGEVRPHSQVQRDLLAVWVAYANWKAVAAK